MATYAYAAIECHDPQYATPLFDRMTPWAHVLAGSRRRHG